MRQNRGEAKAQASKIAEIRNALVSAGCDTTGKQAAALGVGRSTAHALLNRDRRAGPSARVVKRVLSSPTLPVQAHAGNSKNMSRTKSTTSTVTVSDERRLFVMSCVSK